VCLTHRRDGGEPNAFFVDFYRSVGNTLINNTLKQLEAHEHTAQVPYEEREERERKFRTGALPILYCSPTMELGVDIAELNVVNMRNVPPTPANYAQRSGRAGRSGQPAQYVPTVPVITSMTNISSNDRSKWWRGGSHPPV
jgi:ATP-dependent helicase YprA (DUF1998 family)